MAAIVTAEAQSGTLLFQFNRSVKLAFRSSALSSDDGLLSHREQDDALGLPDMLAELIVDPSTGVNGRHRLVGFLCTLATPEGIETWSVKSLRDRLIKTVIRFVRHARYAMF